MTYAELNETLRDVKNTMTAIDLSTQLMADLIVGRLQSGGVNKVTLRKLKRELRDFNMNTWEWRKP